MPASINTPEQMIVTGDARLIVANPDDSPTMPTSATDAVVDSAPWYEVGYLSTDGVGLTDNITTEVIRALQAPAPVRVVSTSRDPVVTFQMMQLLNAANLVMALGGGEVDTDGHLRGPLASDAPVERSVTLDIIDGAVLLRILIPRCGLSTGSSLTFSRSTTANLAVTLAILDPGGGDAMYDWWTDPEDALLALAS
jgi:hypothetical protein